MKSLIKPVKVEKVITNTTKTGDIQMTISVTFKDANFVKKNDKNVPDKIIEVEVDEALVLTLITKLIDQLNTP